MKLPERRMDVLRFVDVVGLVDGPDQHLPGRGVMKTVWRESKHTYEHMRTSPIKQEEGG